MTEEKEKTQEEKEEERRLQKFAHYCRQIAIAETPWDMVSIVPLEFKREEEK